MQQGLSVERGRCVSQKSSAFQEQGRLTRRERCQGHSAPSLRKRWSRLARNPSDTAAIPFETLRCLLFLCICAFLGARPHLINHCETHLMCAFGLWQTNEKKRKRSGPKHTCTMNKNTQELTHDKLKNVFFRKSSSMGTQTTTGSHRKRREKRDVSKKGVEMSCNQNNFRAGDKKKVLCAFWEQVRKE